jgi:DNA processing protein
VIAPPELAAWLRLLETPGVGRGSARKLLAAFGSPQAAIAATPAARGEVVSREAAHALSTLPQSLPALVEATLKWLDAADGAPRQVITLGDPLYPEPLLESPDPPVLLYAQGRAELLGETGVAIVGSRSPTPQGLENARRFAGALSEAGLSIVSGLALGIDGAAHEGALDSGGKTVAVVGTGLDRVYPRAHIALARRIADRGLLLSEYPLGTPSMPAHFPLRNRIIAGLTCGTLVVEAALKSGSLITARLASEAGRDVFAIPGSIRSAQSRGCHWLIRQGAKLVESAEDILEEIRPGFARATAADAEADDDSGPGDPLLAALGHEPATLDALVARTGWPAADLNVRLLELELDGQVARLAGQLFQRVGAA